MWPFKKKANDPADPEEALKQRIVRLDGEITDATATVAIAQLLFLQDQNVRKPITLRIESPGGSVTAAMAMAETVRTLRPPVHTRAPTMALGISLLVLASGYKGERTVGHEAELSFAPIENSPGSSDNLDNLRKRIADILAALCGQQSETVTHYLSGYRSLSPSEAVTCGLADRVLDCK